MRRLNDAEKSDLYGVLAYFGYATSPITRQDRAESSKDLIFTQYAANQQAFLDFDLAEYVKGGVGGLHHEKLPALLELKYSGSEKLCKSLAAQLRTSSITKPRYSSCTRSDQLNVGQIHIQRRSLSWNLPS